jgi:DNA-binding protein HU-beta
MAHFMVGNFPDTRRQLVNRSELVDAVVDSTDLDKRQSESAVKAVVDAVTNVIKSGEKVSIFGFGTFAPTSKAARVGRNPQTGAAVNIAASTGVRFSPATALKALLNPKPVKKGAKKAAAAAKKSAPAPAPAAAKKSAPAAAKKSAPAPAPAAKKSAPAPAKKSAPTTAKKSAPAPAPAAAKKSAAAPAPAAAKKSAPAAKKAAAPAPAPTKKAAAPAKKTAKASKKK